MYNCTLIHGDYRLDNMFFDAGRVSDMAKAELGRDTSTRSSAGEVAGMKLIDFQLVKESNPEIDMVSGVKEKGGAARVELSHHPTRPPSASSFTQFRRTSYRRAWT